MKAAKKRIFPAADHNFDGAKIAERFALEPVWFSQESAPDELFSTTEEKPQVANASAHLSDNKAASPKIANAKPTGGSLTTEKPTTEKLAEQSHDAKSK